VAAGSIAANAYLFDRVQRITSELGVANVRITGLNVVVERLNQQQKTLDGQLQKAQSEALNPTVKIWNDCGGSCAIGPGAYRVGTVPDTFTYHLKFTSSASVDAYFLTVEEYARLTNCPAGVRPAAGQNRLGACASAWVLKGQVPPERFTSGIEVTFDFHLAEGCASYLIVMFPTAAGQTAELHPDVSVTYHPASAPTGECAQG
jgi:hypothetical protein